jgi:DNA mismatch repair protein MSH6
LQLLEVEGYEKKKTKGSLYDYLDRCKTYFGKRLLKKWICSPLADIDLINDRLDAIDDLIAASDAVKGF